MYAKLRENIVPGTDWEGLIREADDHRIGPLLYSHLQKAGVEIPASTAISLKSTQIVTRKSNAVRYIVLREILQCFGQYGIDTLILKGGALAKVVYPDISLRPMADIDLWVRPPQAEQAYYLLDELGFELAPSILNGLPEKNHHFAPVTIVRDNEAITLEIHRRLFRPGGEASERGLTFERVWKTSSSFDIDGVEGRTLGPVEMLWHVYRHCCCGSLRYLDGDFHLVRIADFVGGVEKWVDVLDWNQIRREYPELLNILPLIHFLSPWSENFLARLTIDTSKTPGGVGRLYVGYPSVYMREHKARGFWSSVSDTLLPHDWWFRLHYGVPGNGWRYWLGRLNHVLWVLGDLVVYLIKLGLGSEKPDPVVTSGNKP